MTRLFTRRPAAVMVFMAGIVCPAVVLAQFAPAFTPKSPPVQIASLPQTELRGTVVDEEGQSLGGVVVSALGGTTAFAVSDRNGRFTLRDLSAGPYLVRAHLQGYVPARAKIIQVTTTARDISIALTRVQGLSGQPQILQAGIGGVDGEESSSADDDSVDHGEIAWRLRHLRRSVLKDLDGAIATPGGDGSFMRT